MNGIDISVYQKNIDWKAVKTAGIEFAMVKAGQGGRLNESGISPFEDPMFEQHVREATEAGIKCGAYFYLMGTTRDDVLREAEFFIRTLDKVRGMIVYPCAVDMEDARFTRLDRDCNAALIKVFCGAVQEAGYIPMIYTNRAFSTHFINMKVLRGYDVWFALYRKSGNEGSVPDDVPDITMWQWGVGKVPGIKGDVNMDIGYKDYDRERDIRVGDIVMVKHDAEYYFNGGPRIPSWVKGNRYRVARTQINGSDVYRGGQKCVLLGAYIDSNGEAQGSIMTWIAVDRIELI